jgi:hypothetical protein
MRSKTGEHLKRATIEGYARSVCREIARVWSTIEVRRACIAAGQSRPFACAVQWQGCLHGLADSKASASGRAPGLRLHPGNLRPPPPSPQEDARLAGGKPDLEKPQLMKGNDPVFKKFYVRLDQALKR